MQFTCELLKLFNSPNEILLPSLGTNSFEFSLQWLQDNIFIRFPGDFPIDERPAIELTKSSVWDSASAQKGNEQDS